MEEDNQAHEERRMAQWYFKKICKDKREIKYFLGSQKLILTQKLQKCFLKDKMYLTKNKFSPYAQNCKFGFVKIWIFGWYLSSLSLFLKNGPHVNKITFYSFKNVFAPKWKAFACEVRRHICASLILAIWLWNFQRTLTVSWFLLWSRF